MGRVQPQNPRNIAGWNAARHDAVLERLATHEKACARCKQRLDLSQFSSDASKGDGFSCYCRPCGAAQTRAYRARQRARQQVLTAWRDRLAHPRPELPDCCTPSWTSEGWQHDPACIGRKVRARSQADLIRSRNGLL